LRQVLIHFDVADHFVRIDTFIGSALAAKQAVEAINSTYFNNKLALEIVMFAPETGSLKQYIGVKISSVTQLAFITWATIQVMDSGTVQDISQELFGLTPSEMVVESIQYVKSLGSDDVEIREEEETERKVQILEEVIARSASRTLEISRDKIIHADVPERLKFELQDAQSKLFDSALRDKEVKSIGFNENDDFPIPRNQFAERAVKPIRREEEEIEEDEWIVELTRIRVTSPNFDRDDQIHRRWKGKSSVGDIILFEILDEEFWQKLRQSKIDFDETTEIEAQLAYRLVKGKIKERRVIRVTKVDNLALATPLTDDATRSIIGEFRHQISRSDSSDLFGE
jgi:hypothetical protein